MEHVGANLVMGALIVDSKLVAIVERPDGVTMEFVFVTQNLRPLLVPLLKLKVLVFP